MTPQIEILPDADRLAEAATGRFLQSASRAVQSRGVFTVALSGGSTPRGAYSHLAGAQALEWGKALVFWGDERCVPPEHPQSNYRLARESLLRHIPIPAGNIHRMPGELEPEAAAQEYERELSTVFSGNAVRGSQLPRFDLILLGLGRDGHTASVFPGSTALSEQERWVVAQPPVGDGPWRLTLTPPVINAASEVLFLVAGHDKADILRRVLHGPRDPLNLPAQAIQPSDGELMWLLDAAAASLL